MKFANLLRISIYTLVLLTLIDVITNTETNAKSNTKANTKIKASGKLKNRKSESMMEYLNNFYSEKSSMNIESYLAEGRRSRQDQNTTVTIFQNNKLGCRSWCRFCSRFWG